MTAPTDRHPLIDGPGTAWVRDCGRVVSPAGSRCLELLDLLFVGIYHIGSDVLRTDWSHDDLTVFEVRIAQPLATFDGDLLTRLVVAAHDAAVRVEVAPCNPHYLRLRLSPRRRHGHFFYSHPALPTTLGRLGRLPEYTDPLP